MTPRVVVSSAARDDLLTHYLYISTDNSRAAERFLEAVAAMFLALARMPRRGRRWESRRPELAEVRCEPVRGFRNYVIFYRPIDDGIEVLHVFHGAQNIRERLNGEDA